MNEKESMKPKVALYQKIPLAFLYKACCLRPTQSRPRCLRKHTITFRRLHDVLPLLPQAQGLLPGIVANAPRKS